MFCAAEGRIVREGERGGGGERERERERERGGMRMNGIICTACKRYSPVDIAYYKNVAPHCIRSIHCIYFIMILCDAEYIFHRNT